MAKICKQKKIVRSIPKICETNLSGSERRDVRIGDAFHPGPHVWVRREVEILHEDVIISVTLQLQADFSFPDFHIGFAYLPISVVPEDNFVVPHDLTQHCCTCSPPPISLHKPIN